MILKKYLAINPEDLGFRTSFLGFEEAPKNIVQVPNQVIDAQNGSHIIPTQYLPVHVFHAYERLNTTMQIDINKRVLVLYGYRSPARQAFIFFDILERIYDFDFKKTIRRVCFPSYSEHVCSQRQAIDFTTAIEGRSEDFGKTQEYEWLKKNASTFGFYESYPKNNVFDMMYEPWHWHYEAS